MIKILRNKDFNITDFLVDNVEDVNELKNTNGCAAGSTAYIITTGETYIKKTNGDWIEKIETNNESNDTNDSNNGTTTVAVQSDWNQNNPDEPDYIKNRFGGYESSGINEELIPTEERDFVAGESGYTYYYYSAEESNIMSSLGGAGIRVIWDGETYDFDAPTTELSPDYHYYTQEGVFRFDTSGRVLAYDAASSHTFGIFTAAKTTIATIPEKYLPNTVATKEYVNNYVDNNVSEQVQPDWNQSDETQPNYIKNKIGGYNYYSRQEIIVSEAEYTFTDNGKYYSLELTLPEYSTAYLDFVIDGVSHIAGENYTGVYTIYFEATSGDGKTSIYYDKENSTLKIYGFEGENHNVEVITVEKNIQVVPMQYLPSGLATQEWVNNAIAEAIANLNTSA